MDRVEKVLARIDRDELVDLATRMTAIPSVSGEEQRLGEFMQTWLAGHGIETTLQVCRPNRPNAIGVLKGKGGPSLILNGHIDMVAPLPGWRRPPYEPWVENGRLYGAGITNMKAQVACMAVALVALKRAGGGAHGDVILTAVSGECDLLGMGTRHFLTEGLRADYAICGEPSRGQIVSAHGGVCQFRIVLHGIAAHVKDREKGINAIRHGAKVMLGLDDSALTFEPHLVLDKLPRLTLGMIEGGVLPSITAPRCVITGDIRLVPGMTEARIRADLERFLATLAASEPGFNAELEIFVYEPPFVMDPGSPVIGAVAEAHASVWGARPPIDRSCRMGGTDSSHLWDFGIPTALYGPGFWTVEVDESMDIDEMVNAARVYAQVPLRLAAA